MNVILFGGNIMKIKDLDKEIIKEMTSAGAIATSMGNGNGFANGGPGVMKREPAKKKKAKRKKA